MNAKRYFGLEANVRRLACYIFICGFWIGILFATQNIKKPIVNFLNLTNWGFKNCFLHRIFGGLRWSYQIKLCDSFGMKNEYSPLCRPCDWSLFAHLLDLFDERYQMETTSFKNELCRSVPKVIPSLRRRSLTRGAKQKSLVGFNAT